MIIFGFLTGFIVWLLAMLALIGILEKCEQWMKTEMTDADMMALAMTSIAIFGPCLACGTHIASKITEIL